MLELGLFWGLSLFGYVLLKLFVSNFKKKQSFSKIFWRSQVDAIFMRPFEILLLIIVLSYSAIWVLRELDAKETSFRLILVSRDIGGVFCVAFALFRWKAMFYDSLLSRKESEKISLDPTTLGFLNKLFTLFVGGISVLSILHILGTNIWPLITFGGIGALSAAFASKDIFANFFSGLMLHMTRPFAVSDEIELPGKHLKGHIEEIGWCLTRVRDSQEKSVYLPNSLFSSEALVNHSRPAQGPMGKFFLCHSLDWSSSKKAKTPIKKKLK